MRRLLPIAFAAGALLATSNVLATDRVPDKGGPKASAVEKPRTLEGYVEQEKVFYDFLKKNHPLFTVYEKQGRLVGKYTLSDREEEFVEFGGGKDYHQLTGRTTAMTYRLPRQSFLDLPNQYVGPEKCGECHPAQYEKWSKSRHAKTLRFPDEVTEVKSVKDPLYGNASILPEGITPDFVFGIVGTPRTKYGFIDPWLVRGTYHVEGGTLKDRTGKLVAGGNQHSRTWAESITPEVAKEIATWVPGFPTKLEEFGDSGSASWGMTSYGAKNRKSMMFQPASSYCETCHSVKFDFASQDELLKALGNPAELRKHTISKGITCEECHGPGAHLVGAVGSTPSNCERCHQRFQWNADDQVLSSYFKSTCPSCGTEGSQSFYTSHRQKGMTCGTCHDPHEVTANDWRETVTVPGLRQQCEDCHAAQAAVFAKNDVHGANKCSSCHMPSMMSCENFTAIQFPDQAGFDTQRTAHIWKIVVDPEAKTLNPPPGKSRESRDGRWRLARKDGKPFVDLMWSCGRTTWADDDLKSAGGCHSPVLSELPDALHFKNQRQIYDVVVGWQQPVKDGLAAVDGVLGRVRPVLQKPGKLQSAKVAQATLMVNQAEQIVTAIRQDGSSGVHAPKYALAKLNEAKLLAKGAADLVGVKEVRLTQR